MASDHKSSTHIPAAAPLSRRRLVGVASAGSGAVLLGRDPAGTEARARFPEDHAAVESFHGAWPYSVTPTGHDNTFVTDGTALTLGIYHDLMEMPLAMYRWQVQSWLWLLATVDGDKYVVYLRRSVCWMRASHWPAAFGIPMGRPASSMSRVCCGHSGATAARASFEAALVLFRRLGASLDVERSERARTHLASP